MVTLYIQQLFSPNVCSKYYIDNSFFSFFLWIVVAIDNGFVFHIGCVSFVFTKFSISKALCDTQYNKHSNKFPHCLKAVKTMVLHIHRQSYIIIWTCQKIRKPIQHSIRNYNYNQFIHQTNKPLQPIQNYKQLTFTK